VGAGFLRAGMLAKRLAHTGSLSGAAAEVIERRVTESIAELSKTPHFLMQMVFIYTDNVPRNSWMLKYPP
jgi:hypothetical protein